MSKFEPVEIESVDFVIAAPCADHPDLRVEAVVAHVRDTSKRPRGDLLAGVTGPTCPEELAAELAKMDAAERRARRTA